MLEPADLKPPEPRRHIVCSHARDPAPRRAFADAGLRGGVSLALVALQLLAASALAAGEAGDNFARTHSQAPYVHHIHLYDVNKKQIDPADPKAGPYSPLATCGKCHAYDTIAHGFHFNAADPAALHGRRGEPWVWVDRKTGTQLPLSDRAWAGAWKPQDLGITRLQFLVMFGRHMPGTAQPAPATDPDAKRSALTGELAIDCMSCHALDRSYSHERWTQQIEQQNFAWAPTAAMGLARIEGKAASLPEDHDPAKSPGVQTLYDPRRFDPEGKVFFDLVRKPPNSACYQCHSTREVGPKATPRWQHDDDVHVKAGLACADCHRNGLDHHTVRGYDGEKHPAGTPVHTLSCAGCHMDQLDRAGQVLERGGRLGAPLPLHKGIPPIHFEKLSCTACHAGPQPAPQAQGVQTSMAHALGQRSHDWSDEQLPEIAQGALIRNDRGVIAPHRVLWPAYWGVRSATGIRPMNPDEAAKALRKSLRVRKDFREELTKVELEKKDLDAGLGEARAAVPREQWTTPEREKLDAIEKTKAIAQFRDRLTKGLQDLAKSVKDGTPVYVSGGKVYALSDKPAAAPDEAPALTITEDPLARPYTWQMGHNVRPARDSLGVKGCIECHSPTGLIFHGQLVARGPAPDDAPLTASFAQLQGQDPALLLAWEQSFQGRDPFKVMAWVGTGLLSALLALYALIALSGLWKAITGRRA